MPINTMNSPQDGRRSHGNRLYNKTIEALVSKEVIPLPARPQWKPGSEVVISRGYHVGRVGTIQAWDDDPQQAAYRTTHQPDMWSYYIDVGLNAPVAAWQGEITLTGRFKRLAPNPAICSHNRRKKRATASQAIKQPMPRKVLQHPNMERKEQEIEMVTIQPPGSVPVLMPRATVEAARKFAALEQKRKAA